MRFILIVITLFLVSCSDDVEQEKEVIQKINGVVLKTKGDVVIVESYFSDPQCTSPIYRVNLTTEIHNNYISGFDSANLYLSVITSSYIGDVWINDGECKYSGYYDSILFNGEYRSIFYNTTPVSIPNFLYLDGDKLRVKNAI